MQVGQDIVTSANCKFQLQFQPTNIYQLLNLTSSTYFQSAAVMADGILIPNLHKALPVGHNELLMSIEQKDIIDFISTSPDGKIVLTISDHLV